MNWFLITPYNTSNVNLVYNSGAMTNRDPDEYARGVRPVIVLKSAIKLSGGNGTISNPYKIKDDNLEIKDNITLLNTRQSGEYVKFGNNTVNNVFRIVGTELVGDKLTTKLILNDYFRDDSGNLVKKYFADDSVYGDGSGTDYWDYYLNNTYLNTLDSSMLEKGTYYTTPYDVGKTGGYKKIVCSSVDSNKSISDCIKEGNIVSNKWTGFVGFPRYGDVFAAQIVKYSDTQQFFLINSAATDINYQWYIIRQNNMNSAKNTQQAARPTINLTSSVVIKSGSGTEKEPFVVGLPSE